MVDGLFFSSFFLSFIFGFLVFVLLVLFWPMRNGWGMMGRKGRKDGGREAKDVAVAWKKGDG